jgi:hypothetical protein
MPTRRTSKKRSGASLLVGVGLDGDGETRITRGRDFVLAGGSKETHERMTEHAVRVNEELDRRGMALGDVRSAEELREIVVRAWR